MPYILESKREKILKGGPSEVPGDLNFLFSTLINEYIETRGLSYSSINDVIGVLECCKLELYRRVAAPYEDVKCKENGDLF